MARHRAFLIAGLFLVLGIGAGWFWQSLAGSKAQAQFVDDEVTAEQRDRLFAQLHKDVAHLEQEGNVLKTVVRLVSPTVVHIEAVKRTPGAKRGSRQSIDEAGSGVVIQYNSKFYVLTNRHVIKDAEFADITIHFSDGRELHPVNLWTDADTDIAVILLNDSRLYAARLGDSDQVEIGDFVLAVGSPFGLSHSVTYGIISAKGRRDLQLGDDSVRFQDFMQTDAAINPGNSGGPLLNLRGEVIGINTAIASNSGGNEGIGFSIPINMVMIIARQLIDRGTVSRAFLGVSLDPKFGATTAAQLGLTRLQGARITAITPSSPAAASQLKVGDVVLEFGGIRIQDDNHLVNLVSLTEVDKEVPLVVFRDKQKLTIMVKVGDRRKLEQRSEVELPRQDKSFDLGSAQLEVWDIDELGVSVAVLNPALARRMRLSEEQTGLVITEIDPRGPAVGRVTTGEVFDQVNQQSVANVDDLDHVLAAASALRGVRLRLVPRETGTQSARTVVLVPRSPAPMLR